MRCPNCPDPEVSLSKTNCITSFAALCNTANAGCPSCTFIRDGIRKLSGPADCVNVSFRPSDDDPPRKLMATVLYQIDKLHMFKRFEFYTDDERVSRVYSYLPAGPCKSPDSSSAECLGKAKTWLNLCLEKHGACVSSKVTRLLPTRLVDVGSETQNPFLYETDHGEMGSYVALSYCWGSTRTFTTTTSTLQTRKESFMLEALPETIRDAVIVARALQVQYIWVDQLCIIQDSHTDWHVEASTMCSVYQNSLVTLAALSSPNSESGLFVAKRDQRFVTLPVTSVNENAIGTIYAHKENGFEMIEGIMHNPHAEPGYNTLDNVLKHRLWTLQETALARRILWFSAWELGWSCTETIACECQPNLRPYDNRVTEDREWRALTRMSKLEDIESKLSLWHSIVVDSTKRRTTHQTDRLPAIAGLAAAMEQYIGRRYFAGLWERNIETSLLWVASPDLNVGILTNSEASPIPPDYAPSWSWASLSRGEVEFKSPYKESLWSILSVAFSPTTLNDYGPGQGMLTIEGTVVPLHILEQGTLDIRKPFGPKGSNILHAEARIYPDSGSTLSAAKQLYFIFTHMTWFKNGPIADILGLVRGLIIERSSDKFGCHATLNQKVTDMNFTMNDATRDKASAEKLSRRMLQRGHDIDPVYRRIGCLEANVRDFKLEVPHWLMGGTFVYSEEIAISDPGKRLDLYRDWLLENRIKIHIV